MRANHRLCTSMFSQSIDVTHVTSELKQTWPNTWTYNARVPIKFPINFSKLCRKRSQAILEQRVLFTSDIVDIHSLRRESLLCLTVLAESVKIPTWLLEIEIRHCLISVLHKSRHRCHQLLHSSSIRLLVSSQFRRHNAVLGQT